jgi:sulfur-oxidizing protein SoxY
MTEIPTRRVLIKMLGGAGALAALPLPQQVLAETDALAKALAQILGDAIPRQGGIRFDVPALVENGNSVPVAISVDSPMTIDSYVTDIHVFAEKNPEVRAVSFSLTPANGLAAISTRIKLAASQKLTVIARNNDGSFCMASADVIVTLAACIEQFN